MRSLYIQNVFLCIESVLDLHNVFSRRDEAPRKHNQGQEQNPETSGLTANPYLVSGFCFKGLDL